MDDQGKLQGRIIALELIIQGFMTQFAVENGNPPSAFIDGWRSEMKASLQHLERPIGEYSDAVWAAAISSLDLMFDNVKTRVSKV